MIIRIRKGWLLFPPIKQIFWKKTMMMNNQQFQHQPVTSMVDRMTINSNVETGSRCPVETLSGPSVVAEEFIRPESKSPVIVLDPRRFIPHHQQFKVFYFIISKMYSFHYFILIISFIR